MNYENIFYSTYVIIMIVTVTASHMNILPVDLIYLYIIIYI